MVCLSEAGADQARPGARAVGQHERTSVSVGLRSRSWRCRTELLRVIFASDSFASSSVFEISSASPGMRAYFLSSDSFLRTIPAMKSRYLLELQFVYIVIYIYKSIKHDGDIPFGTALWKLRGAGCRE